MQVTFQDTTFLKKLQLVQQKYLAPVIFVIFVTS